MRRAALLLALLVAGCVDGEPVGPLGCWEEHRFIWAPGSPVVLDTIVTVCDRP